MLSIVVGMDGVTHLSAFPQLLYALHDKEFEDIPPLDLRLEV